MRRGLKKKKDVVEKEEEEEQKDDEIPKHVNEAIKIKISKKTFGKLNKY